MLFEVSSNGLFALSYVLRQLRNAALAVLLHTAESCFNALLALFAAVFIGLLLLAEILLPNRCTVLYLSVFKHAHSILSVNRIIKPHIEGSKFWELSQSTLYTPCRAVSYRKLSLVYVGHHKLV